MRERQGDRRGPHVDVAALRSRLPAHPRTRFAPSPTGYLHLGHVVNAIYVWGLARALAGTVVVRIEDHDRTRCRAAFVEAIVEDLDWLGFAADLPLDGTRTWRQSAHADAYDNAVETLRRAGGQLFWCACSRREIAAAATAAPGSEAAYPLTCARRQLGPAAGRSLRVVVPDGDEHFDDGRLGLQVQSPRQQCGALLIRDRDACWTYQWAVAVDDLRHSIDLVVRGDDLLASTGRQILLGRWLGRPTPAVFVHHGLVRHPHGDKLSKSNRDTGVGDLRRAGWSPERVVGHAAWLVGLTARDEPMTAHEAGALVPATLP
jgi:glutamyl-tRNA synthetase/glutamyl-Q tRNA(Asp) synthetase